MATIIAGKSKDLTKKFIFEIITTPFPYYKAALEYFNIDPESKVGKQIIALYVVKALKGK